MAIKWGSTKVTAVKWGSTSCTCVKWGSTVVFPDGYNGSSFTYPIASGFDSDGLYATGTMSVKISSAPYYVHGTASIDSIDFSQYSSMIITVTGFLTDPGGDYSDSVWHTFLCTISNTWPSSSTIKGRYTAYVPKDNSTRTVTIDVSEYTSTYKLYITYCVDCSAVLSNITYIFNVTGISFI